MNNQLVLIRANPNVLSCIMMLRLLALSFFFASVSSYSAQMNLKEIHQKALEHVFETKIQEARTQQSRERLSQAYGSVLPSVSLRASYSEVDPIPDIPAFDNSASEAAVNFSQPLLRGLREYSALKIAEQRVEQELITQEVIEREVLFQVARVYFYLLIQDKELANTQRLVELTSERVSDLKRRVEIGRSRKSELLLAESQVATAKARVKSIEREKASWVAEFERLTGLKESEVELAYSPDDAINLDSLNTYLAKIENLPEIQRARQEVSVNDSEIQLQKRFRLPDLTLDGNVYLGRTGFRRDSVWDFSVNLVFPLFEGNQVSSRIKEASLQKVQANYEMRNMMRSLEKEIKELYSLVDLDLKRIEVTQTSVRLSKENYEEQRREYNLGLVTNLEVLQSLDAYIANQQELDRLLLEASYNHTVLQAKINEI